MASIDLKTYARRGAEIRVSGLNSELETIYSVFPDLRPGSTGRGRGRKVVVNHEEQVTGSAAAVKLVKVEEPIATGTPGGRRRRRKMTAAQRKAVGERMRKYWAERKAASGSKKR